MINDYSELIIEAADRTGSDKVVTKAPMLLGMAEDWLSKKLRARSQQTAATLTTDANGDVALPAAYEEMDTVYVGLDEIHRRPLDAILRSAATGYAIQGSTFKSSLTSTAHSVVYYASIPTLSATSSTNWLLSAQPELYLHALMMQAFVSERDYENATAVSNYLQGLVDDFNKADWDARDADTVMRIGGTVV